MLVGLALLGVSIYYLIDPLHGSPAQPRRHRFAGFARLRRLLISIFAVSGGIFTKGADVGGDLVGRSSRHSEDDRATRPPSPTMSATMSATVPAAADLFGIYAVTVVATMVLGAIFFGGTAVLSSAMLYPLAICAASDLDRRHLLRQARFQRLDHGRSIRADRHRHPSSSRRCHIGNARLGRSAPSRHGHHRQNLFICGLVGLVVTGRGITEYYTGTKAR
jgi:K(+)-stimulated pyrophosphate-energized sodium pump